MSDRTELERRLRDAAVPDEDGAEERAWEVVRAAYVERAPIRPGFRARRLALALAGGAMLLAIGLSPAGAKVGDLVEDVTGIGEEDAKPALTSLPTAGELLVESEAGVWIVRSDGSKRLLGDYEQATWSPRGLFVAATDGRELVAVDPLGEVRWTVTRPRPVADPRWSPSGFRIAYRTGDDLRVVAGDGTDDRVVARGVAPVAPAWRPVPEAKLQAAPATGSHLLTYVEANDRRDVRTVDVDSGRRVKTTTLDFELLFAPSSGTNPGPGRAISPDGSKLARVTDGRRGQAQVEVGPNGGESRVVFSGPGHLTGPSWSPDGDWLLVGWREADQWLFIRPDRSNRVVAIDAISSQFDPGGTGGGSFPRVAGWILPQL